MSTTSAAPAGAPDTSSAPAPAPGPAPRPLAGEACPLCGAPLHPEQEWCLNCGAAARTRLAASPNWRAPLVAAAIVAVLSLGVLAVALVKLAGGSGQGHPATTRTVTTLSRSLAPSATATLPAITTTVPTLSTPTTTATATTPSATSTTSTGASSPAPGSTQLTPGARNEFIERLRKRTGISVERLRKLGLIPAKK